MSAEEPVEEVGPVASWVGWCCPYCAAPLEPRPHGLWCAAEQRWLATRDGIHRLLPEERRREVQPVLEMLQRIRRDQGPAIEPGLPRVRRGHPQERAWRARAQRLRQALGLLRERLGPGPWRVLQAGAGCAWVGARLLEMGHHVAAVDVDLDPDAGLPAAQRLLAEGAVLPRAEAEIDALPLEPGRFDLVVAAGALHLAPRVTRALVELRRVTRRRGVLLVLDSPVFRHRVDGEARVVARMAEQHRRYGWSLPRDHQPGYLVLGELPDLFRTAGWRPELHAWPSRAGERLGDLLSLLRHGRRLPRHPILIGRRDG